MWPYLPQPVLFLILCLVYMIGTRRLFDHCWSYVVWPLLNHAIMYYAVYAISYYIIKWNVLSAMPTDLHTLGITFGGQQLNQTMLAMYNFAMRICVVAGEPLGINEEELSGLFYG